ERKRPDQRHADQDPECGNGPANRDHYARNQDPGRDRRHSQAGRLHRGLPGHREASPESTDGQAELWPGQGACDPGDQADQQAGAPRLRWQGPASARAERPGHRDREHPPGRAYRLRGQAPRDRWRGALHRLV
ncbi:MAG: SSU ribosomal protein S8p (S15Ae), partial [uncultured Thermomicrobiales bacterium]